MEGTSIEGRRAGCHQRLRFGSSNEPETIGQAASAPTARPGMMGWTAPDGIMVPDW